MDTFSAAGAACGPVYDVADLITDEHVQVRESFVELESPDGEGPVLQLRPAPRSPAAPASFATADSRRAHAPTRC